MKMFTVLWNTAKAVLRRKFIALNVYIRQKKKFSVFYLKLGNE